MTDKVAALLIGWLALSANAPAALPVCASGTLTGRYIFEGRGFIEPLDPGIERAHYGLFVFDGRGRLSGKQSSSRGGKIGRELLEGTYVLNTDCSGTATFGFAGKPESVTHWDMYVTDDGKAGQMIRTDDGSMAVRTFQK